MDKTNKLNSGFVKGQPMYRKILPYMDMIIEAKSNKLTDKQVVEMLNRDDKVPFLLPSNFKFSSMIYYHKKITNNHNKTSKKNSEPTLDKAKKQNSTRNQDEQIASDYLLPFSSEKNNEELDELFNLNFGETNVDSSPKTHQPEDTQGRVALDILPQSFYCDTCKHSVLQVWRTLSTEGMRHCVKIQCKELKKTVYNSIDSEENIQLCSLYKAK